MQYTFLLYNFLYIKSYSLPLLMFSVAPNGPSMYLDFENASSSNLVKDMSGNGNDAAMLKGARISGRKLGEQYLNLGHPLESVYMTLDKWRYI